MSVSSTTLPFAMQGLHWRLHPDYAVWWPDNLPNEISLNFTPFANPADVHRLMFLNFACLTRRVPCTDKKDVMPAAYANAEYWESLPEDRADLEPPCKDPDSDPLPIELLGRDAKNVVIAKIGPEKLGPGPGRQHEVTVTIQQVLKRSRSRGLRIPSSFQMFNGGVFTPTGASVILFLKDDNFNA